MKAIWENQILADSDETIFIESSRYFPPISVRKNYLEESKHTSVCPWKGEAHYYDIVVNEKRNKNGAWYYPNPKESSIERVGQNFTNYIAFWNGVEITQ